MPGVGPIADKRALSSTGDVTLRQPRKIRYTAAEWAVVVERARERGCPPARYVREISLGDALPRVPRGDTNVVIHELGRIGTALTHLAAIAREAGALPEAATLETAVAEVLAAVRRLG